VRVAMIGRYFNRQGGVSQCIAELSDRAGLDHRVDIYANEVLDADGSPAHFTHVPMVERPSWLQTPTFAVAAKPKIRRGNFDLVHSHDAQVLGADLYTAHSCFAAYIGARRLTASPSQRWGSRVHPRHVSGLAMERLAFKSGQLKIITVSGSVRDEVIEWHGRPKDEVGVIYNGVDVERFRAPDRAQSLAALEARVGVVLGDALKIVFVGYEFSRKRLEVAVRALAGISTPAAHLIVAGGADRTGYERLAHDLGVADRVHFLGHTSSVEDVLAACDIFILPTRYEAASLAILEGAAAGLAVVTTDVAMAAEVFTDGEDALLLPNTDDATAATAALQRLVDDPDLLSRLGANARALSERYTWDDASARYAELYEELLERKRRARA
jgi:glycosyltransferase involved in cell wall biosynthesis